MIKIIKNSPPSSLAQYKNVCAQAMKNGQLGVLDDYTDKEVLREQLANEQGFICAYCMQRITLEYGQTRIEHILPKSKYPEKQLDYSNLVLCCNGNEGNQKKSYHCDKSKCSCELKHDPVSHADIESTVGYKYDGRIFSKDSEWDRQLNEVLNLNLPRLRENRKRAQLAIEQVLIQRERTRTKEQLDKIIEGLAVKDIKGCLQPYCGVMLSRIRKHPMYRR